MIIPNDTMEWLDELFAYHGPEAIENPEAKKLLHDECVMEDFRVVEIDYDTVVVRSESFRGRHSITYDCHGEPNVSEVGTYIHKGTDIEIETAGANYHVLEEAKRKQRESMSRDSAALTVGERNPNLGNNRI